MQYILLFKILKSSKHMSYMVSKCFSKIMDDTSLRFPDEYCLPISWCCLNMIATGKIVVQWVSVLNNSESGKLQSSWKHNIGIAEDLWVVGCLRRWSQEVHLIAGRPPEVLLFPVWTSAYLVLGSEFQIKGWTRVAGICNASFFIADLSGSTILWWQ